MNAFRAIPFVLVGAAGALVLGQLVKNALAGGAPLVQPLVYSGMLVQNGTPVADGTQNISVFLWDSATSTAGADRLCSTIPGSPTMVTGGRFQIPLDATCAPIVAAQPDLWVEVTVSGNSLGRTKVGAVPYALEARRAVDVTKPIYVNPTTGKRFSSNAGYCGATAATTGAFVDGGNHGWAAAKSLCETACTSASAHMCTGMELLRWAETGGTIPSAPGTYGWYASGTESWFPNGGSPIRATNCLGFTSAGSTEMGLSWRQTDMSVNDDFCSTSRAIYCCD